MQNDESARQRPKPWREIRGSSPLNDPRGVTLQRLMDAEVALDPRRRRFGVPEETIVELLDELEPDTDEPVEDLYLRTINAYVAALGGRIEVHAVFGDETVTLPVALPQ